MNSTLRVALHSIRCSPSANRRAMFCATQLVAANELWAELRQLVCHKLSDRVACIGVVEVRVCQF